MKFSTRPLKIPSLYIYSDKRICVYIKHVDHRGIYYSFYRHRVVLNDFRKLFAGFLPGQFFGVLAGCIIYMALVNYLGYYISSVLYLLLAQFFLKVKPIPAIISCACIMIVTYLVFSMFLHVPLPLGVWFE